MTIVTTGEIHSSVAKFCKEIWSTHRRLTIFDPIFEMFFQIFQNPTRAPRDSDLNSDNFLSHDLLPPKSAELKELGFQKFLLHVAFGYGPNLGTKLKALKLLEVFGEDSMLDQMDDVGFAYIFHLAGDIQVPVKYKAMLFRLLDMILGRRKFFVFFFKKILGRRRPDLPPSKAGTHSIGEYIFNTLREQAYTRDDDRLMIVLDVSRYLVQNGEVSTVVSSGCGPVLVNLIKKLDEFDEKISVALCNTLYLILSKC
jgi:hypothetical protein